MRIIAANQKSECAYDGSHRQSKTIIRMTGLIRSRIAQTSVLSLAMSSMAMHRAHTPRALVAKRSTPPGIFRWPIDYPSVMLVLDDKWS